MRHQQPKRRLFLKLLRYGPPGQERPGLLDKTGVLRDLSGIISDITPDVLSKQSLARLAALDTSSLPEAGNATRLGVPLSGTSKFIGVGLNYSDHAKEAGLPVPTEPIIFMKVPSCLGGPNDNVIKPRISLKMDWEVELGIVIGTRAKSVSEEQALDHVAGYCVVNDVSERHFQMERGGTWDKGKCFDTFGPVGPWLVTTDEVTDPQALSLWLDLNGERVQSGNTANMVFSCAQLVSYISQLMTLMPGDIITTGTPPGVGMGMKPPRYLQAGDVMTLGVQNLGEQHQTVVAE
jgi:2-keto-4-pentenoate hydratase/2-oxohepta-3-ene-1,7-dioic acid hydratase in catechol pathway